MNHGSPTGLILTEFKTLCLSKLLGLTVNTGEVTGIGPKGTKGRNFMEYSL
jgi:hypothetical protein